MSKRANAGCAREKLRSRKAALQERGLMVSDILGAVMHVDAAYALLIFEPGAEGNISLVVTSDDSTGVSRLNMIAVVEEVLDKLREAAREGSQ